MRALVKIHAYDTRIWICFRCYVPNILSSGALPQILNAVVRSIAIDMVNFSIREPAVMISKHKPVRFVLLFLDFYNQIL